MKEDIMIKISIAKAISKGKGITIVPYGMYGKKVKDILNNVFGVKEKMVFDNYKANNEDIYSLNDLSENQKEFVFLLATKGESIAFNLKKQLLKQGVQEKNIINIFSDSCLQNIYLCENKYGSKRYYDSWNKTYEEALKGMNIGCGDLIDNSGERILFSIVDKYIKNVKCIFDVGANIGMYTDEVHKYFPNAVIHSFEPSKVTFKALKDNIWDTNIMLNNLAVSDKISEEILYYNKEGSGLASLYKRDLDYLNINFDKSENIKTITLDKYCEEKNIQNIDLLKMDIEGHEYFALCGAKKLLKDKKIKVIQIEFGGCNIDSRTYFKDFWSLLHEDFKVYRIMRDGLVEISEYNEKLEIFTTTNYAFILKDIVDLLN